MADYFLQIKRLTDPLRHMSFRDFSWEAVHEVGFDDFIKLPSNL